MLVFKWSDREWLQFTWFIVLVNLTIWNYHPLILVLLLISLFLIRIKAQKSKSAFLLIGLVIAFYFLIQLVNYQHRFEKPPSNELRILADGYTINGNQFSAEAVCQNKKFQIFYTLNSEKEKEFFDQLSSHITILVDYDTNPFKIDEDYENYLRNHSYDGVIKIRRIHKVSKRSSSSIFDDLSYLRRKMTQYYRKHFSKETSDFLLALCFGLQTSTFKVGFEKIQSLGIAHLFALSGMHVHFLMTSLKRFFLRIGIRTNRTKFLLVILSAIYYVLSGASKTILRSLVQFLLNQIGFTRYKSFCLTCLFMLLIYPQLTLDRGVSLSFITTFIILLYREKIKSPINFELMMLPFNSLFFSTWQFMTLVFSPLLSMLFQRLVLPVCFLIILLAPFTDVTGLTMFLKAISIFLDLLFKLTPRQLVLGKVSLPVLLIWIVGIMIYFESKKLKKLSIIVILLCFVITKYPFCSQIELVSSGIENYVIIREWPSKVIVFSAPSIPKVKTREKWKDKNQALDVERILIPKLKELGITKIDYWIQDRITDRHLASLSKVHYFFPIKQVLSHYQLSPTIEKEFFSNGIEWQFLRDRFQINHLEYNGNHHFWSGKISDYSLLISNYPIVSKQLKKLKNQEVDIGIVFSEKQILDVQHLPFRYLIIGDETYHQQLSMFIRERNVLTEVKKDVNTINVLSSLK